MHFRCLSESQRRNIRDLPLQCDCQPEDFMSWLGPSPNVNGLHRSLLLNKSDWSQDEQLTRVPQTPTHTKTEKQVCGEEINIIEESPFLSGFLLTHRLHNVVWQTLLFVGTSGKQDTEPGTSFLNPVLDCISDTDMMSLHETVYGLQSSVHSITVSAAVMAWHSTHRPCVHAPSVKDQADYH